MDMRDVDGEELDLVATVRALSAEVERLRALVDGGGGAGPAVVASTAPAIEAEPAAAEAVGRRGAIKRAGMLAAGAVAGGAAIVAATASPAAAETITGSGNPGVKAIGTAGDGLQASTSVAASAAVRAISSRDTSPAIYAQNEAGYLAVYAESDGTAGRFVTTSTAGTAATVQVARSSTAGVGFRVDTAQDGAQIVSTAATPTATGYYARNFALGADITGCTVGARLAGKQAALNLAGTTSGITSTSVSRVVGDVVMETASHDLYVCISGSGASAEYRRLAGPRTAGSFHVLPVPVRVYDSRPGTAPAVGAKVPLSPNVARPVDIRANSSTVPEGATAVLVTILLVNATTGNGNLTVWANGVSKPAANTLVWGGSAGRFTAKETSAISADGHIQVSANLKTDIVIDVVGYYR